MAENTELESCLEVVAMKSAQESAKEKGAIVIPSGYKVDYFDHLLQNPRRVEAVAPFADKEGFVGYCNEFGEAESVLFLDPKEARATAIFDYHKKEGDGMSPGFANHKATLQFRESPLFQRLTRNDRKEMDQRSFAETIEDLLDAIAAPAMAEIIEPIRKFKSSRTSDTVSLLDESNAAYQVGFTSKSNRDEGSARLPKSVTFKLRPYEGSVPYMSLSADLHSAIIKGEEGSGDKAVFWYKLQSFDQILFDYISGVLKNIGDECGAIERVYMGAIIKR